jgi:hypothetical protein
MPNIIRRYLLVLAAVATPLAVGAALTETGAQAQAAKKVACPNKMTAACKKGFKRVCRQTDKNGCCTKSECVQN